MTKNVGVKLFNKVFLGLERQRDEDGKTSLHYFPYMQIFVIILYVTHQFAANVL